MKSGNPSYSFVLAVTISWLFVTTAFAQEDSDRTSELERLKLAGKPVSVNDLNVEPIPDVDNAAWWFSQAEAGRKATESALGEDFNSDQDFSEKLVEKFEAINTAETFQKISKAISANAYVPLVELDSSNFDSINAKDRVEMRSFARLLYFRGAVEIAKGQPHEAAKTALQIIKLSRQPNHYLGLVGFLVRKAIQNMGASLLIEAMETGAIHEPALLNRLQAELSALDNLNDLVQTIDSERVFGLYLLKSQGPLTLLWNTEPYLKTMRLAQQQLALPIAEHHELFDGEGTGGILTNQLLPALKMTRQAAHRELTTLRQLRIQIAFLQQPEAETVESLELPPATKTDPSTGQILTVTPADN